MMTSSKNQKSLRPGLIFVLSLILTGVKAYNLEFNENEYFSASLKSLSDSLDVDLKILNLTLPASSDTLGDEESFSITLVNNGLDRIENIPLKFIVDGPIEVLDYSEVLEYSLESGDKVTFSSEHSFDLSVSGNYRILAFLNLDGDLDASNDSIYSSVTHISHNLPYEDDFEKGDGGWKSLPYCYSCGSNWYWEDLPTGGFGWRNTSSSVSAKILESPVFDLSNLQSDPYLNFDIYVNVELYTGYVHFEYSLDSGNTYQMLEHEKLDFNNSKGWTGSDTDLKIRDLELDSLANYDHVIFRLIMYHKSGNADGTYLDNFSLVPAYLDNYRIEEIQLPEKSILYSDSETIDIKVENVGFNSNENVPITIMVESQSGVQVSEEVIEGELAREESIIYTTKHGFDFSEVDSYKITVFTSLVSDDDHSNDTLYFETSKISSYTASLPYLIDFESAKDSLYSQSTPSIEGTVGVSYESYWGDNDFSVLQADSTNESSKYGEIRFSGGSMPYGAGGFLIISCDLSAYEVDIDTVYCKFNYKADGYALVQLRSLYVRENEDADWVRVFSINSTNGKWKESPKLNISNVLAESGQEYSATTQFRFVSDGISSSDITFSIDDIMIYEEYHDVSITSISGGDSLALNNSVKIGLVNEGFYDETVIPVKILLKDGVSTQEESFTIEEDLAIGETLIYELINPFILNAGDYQLEAINLLDNDLNPLNDTLSVDFYLIPLGSDNDEQILVYPNPFDETLMINGRNIKRVEIYTISGVKVFEKNIEKEEDKINVSKLNSGMYMIRLFSSADQQKDYKLIKQ